MSKVLTSLSDRGRCNRNNNSNSNNHATAPRRYQLIVLLGIKASLVCAFVNLSERSGKNGTKGTGTVYQIRTSLRSIRDMTIEINIARPVLFLSLSSNYFLIPETLENIVASTRLTFYIYF